jgi:hypothetical protein
MNWIGLKRHCPGAFMALFLVLTFSLTSFPSPQDKPDSLQFAAQVVNERITVGDMIEIRVRTDSDSSIELAEPDLSIDLGEFELLDARIEPTKESTGRESAATLVIQITTFQTGDLEVPSIPVKYSVSGTDEIFTGSTKPIPIQVESVLPEDAQDILDIKPPLEIPRNWLPIVLLSILIAALVIAATLLLRRYLKKRQQGQKLPPAKPALPPHVTAYQALEQLRKSKLLERGQLQQFYVRVSEVIRRYFEERFRIDALEMSTPEVLRDLSGIGASGETMSLFREFLDRCDLVKFAKFVPLREQSDRVFELALQIVDSTKETGNAPEGLPGKEEVHG